MFINKKLDETEQVVRQIVLWSETLKQKNIMKKSNLIRVLVITMLMAVMTAFVVRVNNESKSQRVGDVDKYR